MTREPTCPSDLIDDQWALFEPLLPRPTPAATRRSTPATRWSTPSCTWCAPAAPGGTCPPTCRPGRTVYWYFTRWKEAGITDQSRLPCAGRYARPPAERKNPRLGIIDSQSVKGADTLGLPIVVCVMAVSVQERDGAKTTLLSLYLATPVRFVFADAGFAGALVAWTARVLSTTLYIVRKGPAQVGFAVIGRRWVVADPDLVDLPPAAGTQLRAPAPGGRGDGVLGRDRANGPPSDPRPRRDPPAGMDVSGSCFLPPSQARS